MKDNLSEIVEGVVRNVIMERQATNKKLTLSLAKKLAEKIEQKAEEIGVRAVVAIADGGARPILVECMNDSYIASYDIAVNKAYTSVALKMKTSELKKLSQPNEPLYGIQFTNSGQIVIFGGGEPLKINGEIVGGLGVSGGSEEQDTFLAAYGEEIFSKLLI